MNLWASVKSLVWLVLLLAGSILVLYGLVSAGVTQIINPSPDNTAENFVKALGAHRYTGALGQLESGLGQSTTPGELYELITHLEMTQGRVDLVEAQVVEESEQNATTEVQIQFENGKQLTVDLPLVKENGLWKVASIDPLWSLVGQVIRIREVWY